MVSRSQPLVYLQPAVEDAARRIVPGVAENTVADAICAGRVRFGGGLAVVSGDGWQARVRRTPGRLRPAPRAWMVTAITRTQTARREERSSMTPQDLWDDPEAEKSVEQATAGWDDPTVDEPAADDSEGAFWISDLVAARRHIEEEEVF